MSTTINSVIIESVRAIELAASPYFQYLEDNSFGFGDKLKALVKEIPKSPHSENFPLMNPFHVLVIVALYLGFVAVGKRVMQNFEKFSLKTYSLIHNFLMQVMRNLI